LRINRFARNVLLRSQRTACAGNLFPRLKAGQTFAYQISYHSDKQIKTESNVIVATPADSAKIDVNALLSLEILAVQAQGDRASFTPGQDSRF